MYTHTHTHLLIYSLTQSLTLSRFPVFAFGVKQKTGLRGVGIWAFTNLNSNASLPWFDPTCTTGYATLCQGLLDLDTCGKNITTASTVV